MIQGFISYKLKGIKINNANRRHGHMCGYLIFIKRYQLKSAVHTIEFYTYFQMLIRDASTSMRNMNYVTPVLLGKGDGSVCLIKARL